jgi:chromatin assembly factor 1 subunit B
LDLNRLATGGADSHIRIWHLEKDKPIQFRATLSRHAHGVNCVRWSPNGQNLASGGDDGCSFALI